MDDLVWSVTPKVTSQDRKKLLVILPKLLKWLDQGLQFLNTPQAQREPFFAALVKYHTEAVRPRARRRRLRQGLRHRHRPPRRTGARTTTRSATTSNPWWPPLTREDAHGDLRPIRLWSRRSSTPRSRKWRRSSSATSLGRAASSSRTSPTAQRDSIRLRPAGEEHEARHVDRTGPGQRRDFTRQARLGQPACAGSTYSRTGSARRRFRSTRPVWPDKFREGKVRLIDNVPLMDRAVSGLIGRLQNNAAPAADR
jgi:hypothetical protein